MYGYQWVKWEKFKEKEDGSIEKTYINQIKEVINLIKNNPDSRRRIALFREPGLSGFVKRIIPLCEAG